MVAHLHKILVRRIAVWLTTPDAATKRPPLFAAIAHKMTALRRTGQVCGFLALVNGVVVDVLVGDPIVLDCSGAGCAANLIACFRDTLGVDADTWL